MKIEQIKRRLTALHEEQMTLSQELDLNLSKTLVACTDNCYGSGCGKKTQIGKLTHIQPFYYVEPYGCTGGDYWATEDESQWDCPKCGHRNRAYKYDRFEVFALKRNFGQQATTHDRYGRPPKIDEVKL